MEGTDRLYPQIKPYDLEPPQAVSSGDEDKVCDWPVMWDKEPKTSPSPQEVIELPVFVSSCHAEFAFLRLESLPTISS
jgi:hypothetical protein